MAFYNSESDRTDFVISFTSNPIQDFGVFAKGYANAASVLAEQLLEKPRFRDYEAYPVVFLYRQAFELYLKGFYYLTGLLSFFKDSKQVNYKHVNKHWLVRLAETFQKICLVHFPSDESLMSLTEKIIIYAKEFEEIDKASYSYRYPVDTEGNPSTKHHQVVNLYSFHHSMSKLLDELEVVDFGLDVETFNAQKTYEIIKEAEGIVSSENDEMSYR